MSDDLEARVAAQFAAASSDKHRSNDSQRAALVIALVRESLAAEIEADSPCVVCGPAPGTARKTDGVTTAQLAVAGSPALLGWYEENSNDR